MEPAAEAERRAEAQHKEGNVFILVEIYPILLNCYVWIIAVIFFAPSSFQWRSTRKRSFLFKLSLVLRAGEVVDVVVGSDDA